MRESIISRGQTEFEWIVRGDKNDKIYIDCKDLNRKTKKT
jgi:hypothetical protein